MPLIIGKYTHKNVLSEDHSVLREIMEQLQTLPEPQVIPQSKNLNPDSVLLFGQRQGIVHHIGTNFPHQDKCYAGTYNVAPCVGLFISNKLGDKAFIHVDLNAEPNFNKILSSFRDKNVDVILFGGKPDNVSGTTATRLVVYLSRFACEHNITVSVTHQKIMERNKFLKGQKYERLTIYLQNKLNNLSREFFNKEIWSDLNERLNFRNYRKNFEASSLSTVDIDELAGFIITPLSEKNLKTQQYQRMTQFFQKHSMEECVQCIFTKEGFNALDNIFAQIGQWDEATHINNFIVDLRSHDFIHADFLKPGEETYLLSLAKSLDPGANCDIAMVFDSAQTAQKFSFEFSPKFHSICQKYQNVTSWNQNNLTDLVFDFQIATKSYSSQGILTIAYKCVEIVLAYKENPALFGAKVNSNVNQATLPHWLLASRSLQTTDYTKLRERHQPQASPTRSIAEKDIDETEEVQTSWCPCPCVIQ